MINACQADKTLAKFGERSYVYASHINLGCRSPVVNFLAALHGTLYSLKNKPGITGCMNGVA